MVLGTKVAYFSLINVGSVSHCLRSFSFFFSTLTIIKECHVSLNGEKEKK